MKASTMLLQALSASASASALAVAIAFGAAAQPAPHGPEDRAPANRAAPESAQEPTAVSDAELDTFVEIYVDLLDTVAKFDGELQTAQSEQQAAEVRGKIQAESVAKVASRGWTPEKFNSVTDEINRNPNLAEKAARMIDEKI